MCDVTYCPQNPNLELECGFGSCPCCGGLGVAARCPGCDGAGAVCTRTLREAQLAHIPQFERCTECNGRGYFPITTELYERLGFGAATPLEARLLRRPPQKVKAA